VKVALNKNFPAIPLEDRPHHTDTPGILTARSSLTLEISLTHTQSCVD
jgi:hypothetical protein